MHDMGLGFCLDPSSMFPPFRQRMISIGSRYLDGRPISLSALTGFCLLVFPLTSRMFAFFRRHFSRSLSRFFLALVVFDTIEDPKHPRGVLLVLLTPPLPLPPFKSRSMRLVLLLS